MQLKTTFNHSMPPLRPSHTKTKSLIRSATTSTRKNWTLSPSLRKRKSLKVFSRQSTIFLTVALMSKRAQLHFTTAMPSSVVLRAPSCLEARSKELQLREQLSARPRFYCLMRRLVRWTKIRRRKCSTLSNKLCKSAPLSLLHIA